MHKITAQFWSSNSVKEKVGLCSCFYGGEPRQPENVSNCPTLPSVEDCRGSFVGDWRGSSEIFSVRLSC